MYTVKPLTVNNIEKYTCYLVNLIVLGSVDSNSNKKQTWHVFLWEVILCTVMSQICAVQYRCSIGVLQIFAVYQKIQY